MGRLAERLLRHDLEHVGIALRNDAELGPADLARLSTRFVHSDDAGDSSSFTRGETALQRELPHVKVPTDASSCQETSLGYSPRRSQYSRADSTWCQYDAVHRSSARSGSLSERPSSVSR